MRQNATAMPHTSSCLSSPKPMPVSQFWRLLCQKTNEHTPDNALHLMSNSAAIPGSKHAAAAARAQPAEQRADARQDAAARRRAGRQLNPEAARVGAAGGEGEPALAQQLLGRRADALHAARAVVPLADHHHQVLQALCHSI